MSAGTNADIDSLYRAILSLRNKEEARSFFRDLLTEAEIKEFTNRWKVVQLLEKRVQYEDIAKQTGMSSTTIARISKWLVKGKGGYKLMLERLKTNKKTSVHHTSLEAE
jgi:TrpR-related protein YerC/YecD